MQEKRLGDKKRVKPGNWYAMVATPAYDGKVNTGYSQSLAEAAFCCPLYQIGLTASVMGNGAFIELARNIFVKMFLEQHKEATHLFFIDADVQFPASAFVGLMRAGLPICAGVYPRRQTPEDYPVKWAPHPVNGGLQVEGDGWIMCERVPTGFLCISRQVIEEMAAEAKQVPIKGQEGPVPWLFYTKFDEDGRFVGEDFTFCDDYRKKYGKDIPVWPDIDFDHGGFKGNWHNYLNRLIEEEEKMKAAMSTAA